MESRAAWSADSDGAVGPMRRGGARKRGRTCLCSRKKTFFALFIGLCIVALSVKAPEKVRAGWRGGKGYGPNVNGKQNMCTPELQLTCLLAIESACLVGSFFLVYDVIKRNFFSGKVDLGPGARKGGEGPPRHLSGVDIDLPVSQLPQSMSLCTWPMTQNRVVGLALLVENDLQAERKFYESLGMQALILPFMKVAEVKETSDGGENEVVVGDHVHENEVVVGYPPHPGYPTFALSLVRKSEEDSTPIKKGPFGHLTITTDDVTGLYQRAMNDGNATSIGEPRALSVGRTEIAMLGAPSGYQVMVLQKNRPYKNTLCRIKLNVRNLEKSIEFYRKVMGMHLYRTHNSPASREKLAWMGYGNETDGTVLELSYKHGILGQKSEAAAPQMVIMTPKLSAAMEHLEKIGQISRVVRSDPYTERAWMVALEDLDGFKILLVDAEAYDMPRPPKSTDESAGDPTDDSGGGSSDSVVSTDGAPSE